jgi:hypothetical protein
MQQQINLYDFLPKKKTNYLTNKNVWLAYTVFILLLCLFHLTELWQKHSLTSQLNTLTSGVVLQQLKLTELMQKYPETDLANLNADIIKLQIEDEKKSQLIDLLSPYAHFSAYLEGLGHAIVPGVWLTQITFDRGENKIALKGYTLQPKLLASFYSQLEKQPIFYNLTFELNAIKQKTFPASFYITAKKANKA